MTSQEIVERVLLDNPKLHYATPEEAKIVTEFVYKIEPGAYSMAVPPEVIRYMRATVKDDYHTIETGGGQTSVILGALARHHTTIMGEDPKSHELITKYMDEIGLPRAGTRRRNRWRSFHRVHGPRTCLG